MVLLLAKVLMTCQSIKYLGPEVFQDYFRDCRKSPKDIVLRLFTIHKSLILKYAKIANIPYWQFFDSLFHYHNFLEFQDGMGQS